VSVDFLAALLAIALLIGITVRRSRRAVANAAQDEEKHKGPEPSRAEVEAAEQSIRSKTTEAVRQAKAKAITSLLLFLFLVIVSIPFAAGMILHPFFRPWGQLSLIAMALSLAWAILACSHFLLARSFRRSAEKLLDSLEDR